MEADRVGGGLAGGDWAPGNSSAELSRGRSVQNGSTDASFANRPGTRGAVMASRPQGFDLRASDENLGKQGPGRETTSADRVPEGIGSDACALRRGEEPCRFSSHGFDTDKDQVISGPKFFFPSMGDHMRGLGPEHACSPPLPSKVVQEVPPPR